MNTKGGVLRWKQWISSLWKEYRFLTCHTWQNIHLFQSFLWCWVISSPVMSAKVSSVTHNMWFLRQKSSSWVSRVLEPVDFSLDFLKCWPPTRPLHWSCASAKATVNFLSVGDFVLSGSETSVIEKYIEGAFAGFFHSSAFPDEISVYWEERKKLLDIYISDLRISPPQLCLSLSFLNSY